MAEEKIRYLEKKCRVFEIENGGNPRRVPLPFFLQGDFYDFHRLVSHPEKVDPFCSLFTLRLTTNNLEARENEETKSRKSDIESEGIVTTVKKCV